MRIGIRASVLIIGFYCQSIDATDGFTVVQNSSVGVGTREEKYIMLGDGDAIAAIRDGHPRVAGLHHTCISIGPGHPIKSWGGIRSLALALKTILATGKDDDALLGMMTATHRVVVVASMRASLMVI
jgi:hypothetical protein